MELHAVNRVFPVPHAHDRAVFGSRRGLEPGRQRLTDDQRVIAPGDERLRDAAEHAAAVVLHSLFEEQIDVESIQLDRYLTHSAESHAEALDYFPDLGRYQLGPDAYLEHVALPGCTTYARPVASPKLPGYVAISATHLAGIHHSPELRAWYRELLGRGRLVGVVGHAIHVYEVPAAP